MKHKRPMKKRKMIKKDHDPIGHYESPEGKADFWIQKAIKSHGALRKELHAKKGHKIPKAKLDKAAHKKGIEGKRARLAQTLRKLRKKIK